MCFVTAPYRFRAEVGFKASEAVYSPDYVLNGREACVGWGFLH